MICCAAAAALVAGPALGGRLAGVLRTVRFGAVALAAMLVPVDGHASHDAHPYGLHQITICGGLA